jgi:hypothetical protein
MLSLTILELAESAKKKRKVEPVDFSRETFFPKQWLLMCNEQLKIPLPLVQVKSKSLNSVSNIRCGVCIAVIDEVLYELRKTENSTSTLDLRWGLTAEVTEGR